MPEVHLRPVTEANVQECLALRVAPEQAGWVASNVKSLAQAAANPRFVPLAIYDGAARGMERPTTPMVGFTMYEAHLGIGFIERLMIDERRQGRGYGRATMLEVIRRLRLHLDVERIATSHRRENVVAARLYQSLGFVPWTVPWADPDPGEVYLYLAE